MDLPAWAQEAAASREDDTGRKSQREFVLHDMRRSGVYGDVGVLLNAPRVDHNDLRAYATAASLGRLLESRGGKPKLLQFAVDGKRIGWDRALQLTMASEMPLNFSLYGNNRSTDAHNRKPNIKG